MITDQAEAVRAMGRAPRDWINQLRVVAEEAAELAAGNDQRTTSTAAAAAGSGLHRSSLWGIFTVAQVDL